jgi:hypothetical protein
LPFAIDLSNDLFIIFIIVFFRHRADFNNKASSQRIASTRFGWITRIRDGLIACDGDFDLVGEVRGLLDIFDEAISWQKNPRRDIVDRSLYRSTTDVRMGHGSAKRMRSHHTVFV